MRIGNQISRKNFAQTLLISLTVILTGCASTTKAKKYDCSKQQPETQAIVVIGTKNVSYFDLHRYGNAVQQSDATKSSVQQSADTGGAQNSTVISKRAKQTSEPAAQCEDVKLAVNENNAIPPPSQQDSADPMQNDYTDSSFNLKRLFDSSQPSNLGEAIKEDQKKRPSDKKLDSVECKTSSAQSTTVTPVTTAAVAEYRIHKPTIFFSVFNYSKATYNLEPGIYYISFAFYEQKSNVHFTRLAGVKNDVVQYGAFEVKAGDVLYFGDINFDWVNIDKPRMVTITNNFNQVKKDLINSGHRDLAVKITQAKFYPSGSKIVATECGESLVAPS